MFQQRSLDPATRAHCEKALMLDDPTNEFDLPAYTVLMLPGEANVVRDWLTDVAASIIMDQSERFGDLQVVSESLAPASSERRPIPVVLFVGRGFEKRRQSLEEAASELITQTAAEIGFVFGSQGELVPATATG